MLNGRAVTIATIVGTVLQVAMVVAGHSNKSIAALFAVGGMSISLVAGIGYAWNARGSSAGALAFGGLIAGGVCAFIGILVSYLIGDVPATLLILGTASSMVTGAIGGLVGKLFARRRVIAAIVVLAAVPGRRLAAAPPPTVSDFAWLTGAWQATMDNGVGTAYVTYAAPHAGVMTGVMHLVSRENKILVVELITLVDTPRGVEMRFRHFSSTLDAYESEFKQAMLLTAHDSTRDVFENQVPYAKSLMSTQPRTTTVLRRPDGSYVARSDIVGEDGKPSVIRGTYHRVSSRA